MIWGGTIWGNCASGSPRIETSPAMTVTMAITIDTIGRLIKKVDIISEPLSCFLGRHKKHYGLQMSNCRFQVSKAFQISNFKFQTAVYNLQSAICNLRSAICDLKSAI